jgi:hypothetical protein
MNTGQMLLSVGAIVLLGVTVIAVNQSSLQNGTILQQTQIGIYGVSLASSIIDEASGKAFDQSTVDNAVSAPSQLSIALGPETGETMPVNSTTQFNDFDDYNYLNTFPKKDTVPGVDIFTTKCRVYYVNDSDPNTKVTGPTWFKRMDVTVYGSGVADTARKKYGIATGDTIKMSYVYSYLNF